MKTIELRRHSLKAAAGNHDLSPAGITLAENVGKNELRGKGFTRLYVSPLKRTSATLESFGRGAGDFPSITPEIFPLQAIAESLAAMSLWEGVCNRAEHAGLDMMTAALQGDPETAQSIAKQGAVAFQTWLKTLPENTNALVVGHSPFIELIIYGLFGITPPQLPAGAGFIIREDSGKLTLLKASGLAK